MFRTNVASQAVFAQMNSRTDGSPLTSSVSANVTTGAAGSQGAGAGTLTHMGNGQWRYVPTQAETNDPVFAVQFTHASGVNVTLTALTTAADPSSVTRGLAGTALPAVAAGANGGVPLGNASGAVTLAAATHTGAVIPTVSTLTGHTPQTGDAYARLGAPAGASIAADLVVIDNFVDDLETRLTATRAGYLDNLSAGAVATQASVNTVDDFLDTEIATLINRLGAFTGSGDNTVLGVLKALASKTAATPSDIGGTFDPASDSLEGIRDAGATLTDVEASMQTVIETNHLDHLLAVTYDPASKPGASDALLNELVESDSGVARLTANALEQAPSGTGASAATIADAVWDELLSGHVIAGSAGESLADAAAGGGGGLDAAGVRAAIGLASANLDTQLATIDTVADAILADTGTDGVVVAAASKTGYRLSATGVDDVLDEVVLGSYTMRQLIRGMSAALVGKLSGGGTTTVTIRSADDTKNVVVATVDADGNRSAVTLDLA